MVSKNSDHSRDDGVTRCIIAAGENAAHFHLPALLSMREVSKLVSRSRSSLYAMIKTDKFPRGVKIGRATRWFAMDIDAWLRDLKEGGSV